MPFQTLGSFDQNWFYTTSETESLLVTQWQNLHSVFRYSFLSLAVEMTVIGRSLNAHGANEMLSTNGREQLYSTFCWN